MPVWHVGDRGEAELRHSPPKSYFWKPGVQLKSQPGQCDEWEACAVKSVENLELVSRGTGWALWRVIYKKRTRRKILGVKNPHCPLENYNCQITGYVLKAAFMYIINSVFWHDPVIKDIPNLCLLSWKCYLLSEVTLSKIYIPCKVTRRCQINRY